MDGECFVTICNISEMNGMFLVLQMLWQAISVFANQDCRMIRLSIAPITLSVEISNNSGDHTLHGCAFCLS